MGLTLDHLRTGLARVTGSIIELEKELNEADGKLGDGDTGVMLRRLVEKIAAALENPATDVGEGLRNAALAGSSATGSSLGTLIVVGLFAASKESAGKAEIAWADLARLFAAARDAMQSRGRAGLGDKTILDSLHAATAAIDRGGDAKALGNALVESARQALSDFRNKPCKVGRARMFGERSSGLNDPGMLAFTRVMEIALDAPCSRDQRGRN